MIDTEFLDSLAKLNLLVRKRVTSNYSGQRKSVFQGKGMLFKDHRIYAPGDDFRNIDWKIFARTDDLMIKNFEEEKNLTVHIIVDKSASMNFGKPKKFEYASMLGVGFAYLAMKDNDKFQFATFSESVEVYQPKRGLSQVVAMVDYLNQVKLKGKTSLLDLAQQYKKLIGSRSLLIIISDFLLPIEDLQSALPYFKGNEIKMIQVLDPREKYPDMEGEYKLKDAESDSEMKIYFSPRAKDEYTKRLDKHTAALKHECDTMNIPFFQVTSDTDIFEAFYTILQ